MPANQRQLAAQAMGVQPGEVAESCRALLAQ
jgi:hypothetical protein